MKIKELRKTKTEDLDKKLSELKLELSKELGSVKMGRAVKNPGKIKQLRRSIAQIMTLKRESKSKPVSGKGKKTTAQKPEKKKVENKKVDQSKEKTKKR